MQLRTGRVMVWVEVSWVAKAIEEGKGCHIYLKKTHEKTLKLIPIEILKKFAIDLS